MCNLEYCEMTTNEPSLEGILGFCMSKLQVSSLKIACDTSHVLTTLAGTSVFWKE